MPTKITNHTLLQCSRVNVLDVRPALKNRKEPFESIQYSLSTLAEDNTLLIVAPFEPRPLKKYINRENFSYFYDKISDKLHWLAAYEGDNDLDLDISGPGPTYVLPAGNTGHAGYLDCRSMAPDESVNWINSTLRGLGPDDLLVVHCASWDETLRDGLAGGDVDRKSIVSEHVRLEIRPET